jgi:hypothetical protein
MAKQLNLKPGKWVMVDCGSMPSESNCQLIMVAPEDQRDDLIEASVKHAVSKHGHEESKELRDGVTTMCETIDVA